MRRLRRADLVAGCALNPRRVVLSEPHGLEAQREPPARHVDRDDSHLYWLTDRDELHRIGKRTKCEMWENVGCDIWEKWGWVGQKTDLHRIAHESLAHL